MLKSSMTPDPQSAISSTQRSHRWQVAWQILVPLCAAILLLAVLLAFVLAGGSAGIERWAQVAAILLALPTMAVGIAILVMTLLVNSGVVKLIKWLPPRAAQVQRVTQGVNAATQAASRVASRPFIQLEAWGEALRKIFRRRGKQ